MMVRIISAAGLGVLWITGPWYLALLWAMVHIVYFRGLEILLWALMLDVFYANTQAVPYYTLLVVAGLLLAEWVRDSIFLYNK